MPTKILSSPADRNGLQDTFNFGGGANTVIALDPDPLTLFGYIIDGGGGNDTLFGSSLNDTLTGSDGDDTIFGGGGDDTINGGNDDGSADSSKGKNPAPTNILVGDGERLADGTYTVDVNYIDSAMSFTGGNDTIMGGNEATLNRIFGDAENVNMALGSTFGGGNDTLIGGSGLTTNSMFGDAAIATLDSSTFNGGNDTLDANDGGGGTMVGDASILAGTGAANGGDDTLISGTGNETMIGDFGPSASFTGSIVGGTDTFVFGMNNGSDSIADFEIGTDKIDISALEIASGTLDTDLSGFIDTGDTGVTIIVDPNTQVETTQINLGLISGGDMTGDLLTISNVSGLTDADFIFA